MPRKRQGFIDPPPVVVSDVAPTSPVTGKPYLANQSLAKKPSRKDTRPHFTTWIAGTKFRGPQIVAMVKSLPEYTPLTLWRDPENKFDAHAVQVRHKGKLLGFIERKLSKAVTEVLTSGRLIECLKGTHSTIRIYYEEKQNAKRRHDGPGPVSRRQA